jgi:hypothetical protein
MGAGGAAVTAALDDSPPAKTADEAIKRCADVLARLGPEERQALIDQIKSLDQPGDRVYGECNYGQGTLTLPSTQGR